MTRPRVKRDWLIMPASRARLSSAPERPMFSDPARSTRLNLPTLRRSSPVGDDSLMWTVMVKMEWERLTKGCPGSGWMSSPRNKGTARYSDVRGSLVHERLSCLTPVATLS